METRSSPDTKVEKEQESPKDSISQKEEVQQEDNDQEDEESECGFCLFMKGGGCKDAFIAWEKCVEEADNNKKDDIVEKCFEVTSLLKKCMDAHADYYEPILSAEKAMEEEATRESDKELDREASSSSQEAKSVTEETHPTVPTVTQETPSNVASLPKEEK